MPEQTKTGTRADHRQSTWHEVMKIIVTGSIAYDYLMSFPGKFTEHFLPEHMHRVSLSFLVDTMDKRRGGCAPNIAYTLALLGERPLLMATAGEDFGEYRQWLEAAGVDTSLVKQVPASSRRRFSAAPTQDEQPDRVVLHGRDGRCRRAVVPDGRRLRAGDHFAERSRRDGAVRRRMPHARHPLHLRSGPAVRADVRRRAARRPGRRAPSSSATTTSSSCCSRRPGSTRTAILAAAGALIVTRGEHGSSVITREAAIDVPAVTPRRIVDPTGVGDAFRGGLMKGLAMNRAQLRCSRSTSRP